MAVHFETKDPAGLLKQFDSHIAQKSKDDKIKTWVKDTDGYYSHTADQWKGKARFKAKPGEEQLTFLISHPKGDSIEGAVYAFYHGHLIETFIAHFDTLFTTGSATAKPQK